MRFSCVSLSFTAWNGAVIFSSLRISKYSYDIHSIALKGVLYTREGKATVSSQSELSSAFSFLTDIQLISASVNWVKIK